MPVIILLFALTATQIIELSFTWLVGFRDQNILKTVFWINIITNPLLNFSLLLISRFRLFSIELWHIWVMELVIVFVEGFILSAKLKISFRKMFLLSLTNNLASYIFGLFMIF